MNLPKELKEALRVLWAPLNWGTPRPNDERYAIVEIMGMARTDLIREILGRAVQEHQRDKRKKGTKR